MFEAPNLLGNKKKECNLCLYLLFFTMFRPLSLPIFLLKDQKKKKRKKRNEKDRKKKKNLKVTFPIKIVMQYIFKKKNFFFELF